MISFIVPVYNEAESIEELYTRLTTVLRGESIPYELLFVDDGSRDASVSVLKKIRSQDSSVKILSFSRNFGHQVALTAGLDHVTGDAVIMMDADLQHPPELIPKMIRLWKDEGYDVVYTVRDYERSATFFKRITSAVFYRFINAFSQTSIPANAADFRLLSRSAADSLRQLRERGRFMRGLVSWIGFRQASVPYTAGARSKGETKYSLRRMLRFGMDGLVSFSTVPLSLSTLLGFIVSLFSFAYGALTVYWKYFTDQVVQGWATIVVLVLFLGGIQLLCLGIMGEYLGKIYEELKQRPLYIVKERVGL
jgi:dolichol-phosphate mannosyltransferase